MAARHSGTGGTDLTGTLSRESLRAFALVGGIVFVAALCGIATRMTEMLSSFWPANAVLLGVLFRWPRLALPVAWVGAGLAFVAADVVTGSDLRLAIGFSCANLVGVVVGLMLLRNGASPTLETPRDIARLLLAALGASAGATAVGAPCGVLLLDLDLVDAAETWLTAEFVAYIAILPFVLSIPSRLVDIVPTDLGSWAPVVALAGAVGVGLQLGGVVAVLAPLPVLVWSALQASILRTSAMVLLSTLWMLLALGVGLLQVDTVGLTANAQVALQWGLALLVACPLFVAAAVSSAARRLDAATALARQDGLTGLLNRAGFTEAGESVIGRARTTGDTVAVMMLDLDDFKAVNDEFGHPAGDALLSEVGAALSHAVRHEHVVGRIGGEEFAVVAVGIEPREAHDLAERIRLAVRRVDLGAIGGRTVTASLGVHAAVAGPHTSLEHLIGRADQLLYGAKRAGRDQVAVDLAV